MGRKLASHFDDSLCGLGRNPGQAWTYSCPDHCRTTVPFVCFAQLTHSVSARPRRYPMVWLPDARIDRDPWKLMVLEMGPRKIVTILKGRSPGVILRVPAVVTLPGSLRLKRFHELSPIPLHKESIAIPIGYMPVFSVRHALQAQSINPD